VIDPDKLPKLPAVYDRLSGQRRMIVRELYIAKQKGKCLHCKQTLSRLPRAYNARKKERMNASGILPPYFFKFPIHLHHCHKTDLTLGAVHAYCNAILFMEYGQ
jgi:hypothetical protein